MEDLNFGVDDDFYNFDEDYNDKTEKPKSKNSATAISPLHLQLNLVVCLLCLFKVL
jgi:hypothetical protein